MVILFSWVERLGNMNTKQLGMLGELKAQYDFIKHGFEVWVPQGDYLSYDLVVSKNNIIYKIQIKTTEKINNGLIVWNLRSQNYYVNKIYTINDCDYFYLYCLENEKSYLLKNRENMSGFQIRLIPPKNNQRKGIHFEEEFLFDNVAPYLNG